MQLQLNSKHLTSSLISCFTFLLLLLINDEANAQTANKHKNTSTSYKVIGIKDGDTIDLLMEGKKQTIRLEHIDCPEKNQPFGNRAKQRIAELCFGKNVTISLPFKYDRNRRIIATVYLNNEINVNQELVRNGLAWHFKKYSNNQEYASLEIAARKKHLGLWKDPHPMAPWDWRKAKKHSSKN